MERAGDNIIRMQHPAQKLVGRSIINCFYPHLYSGGNTKIHNRKLCLFLKFINKLKCFFLVMWEVYENVMYNGSLVKTTLEEIIVNTF